MKLACAVTTAPRRVSYLDETLESLRMAGFDAPFIVDDGDKAFGPYGNFKRAVRISLQEMPDAEVIAVFQDDVIVAKNLRQWIDDELSLMHDGTGVVSLYCAEKHEFNRTGFHRLPLRRGDCRELYQGMAPRILADLEARGRCFPASCWSKTKSVEIVRIFDDCTIAVAQVGDSDKWLWAYEWYLAGKKRFDISEMQPWSLAYGACAYVMPTVNALRIVNECNHRDAKTKTDIHVAETCQRLKLDYWMRSPSLVQHIGEVSSLDDRPMTPFRRSAQFRQEAVSA